MPHRALQGSCWNDSSELKCVCPRLALPSQTIKRNGLIQPVTVQPNDQSVEIVARARCNRAVHLTESSSVSCPNVEIDDAKALKWQIVENNQRVDVHLSRLHWKFLETPASEWLQHTIRSS